MSTTKWLVAASALAFASVGAAFIDMTPAHGQPCKQYGFDGPVTILEDFTGWVVTFTSKGTVASGQATATNDKTGEPTRTGTVTGGFTSPTDLRVTIQYPEGTQIYVGSIFSDGSTQGYTAQEPFQGKTWRTAKLLSCVDPVAAPPPGSAQQQPPPQQAPPPEQAPKNAISVNFSETTGGLTVNVNNSSNVAGDCTYDATAPNSLIPPTHRDFTVGAKAGTSFQISGIRTGTQYNTVTVCRGNFQGQDVEIGRVEIAKTF
ncbi:hypothetical protein CQY20_27775 [Mycolicibacterium agri]|uniref:Uncharacterized protein n=1 Tax=Mycolicibacterium agri TaxID=36811 RepID=A0A2A7MQM3_MYCAG|nr:hypothetical protein [Mycolicibacterium agri]PEG33996.1 hypothetical protein CQY20_27775 [Mycolicibacterium agri]GFG52909.1 hypothetical protein MAGR_43500 [Mycolicibacterium agri]